MNLARPRRFPGLATLVLAAGIAFSGIASAAGYQHLEIPGSDGQPPVEAIVWSPCAAAAETQQLGPYVVRGIRDCAVSGRSLPLIVVSHGQGGTSLGHHDTAEALADAGFVVVTLNHPGDTFGDDSGAQRLDIFESRPRDVSRRLSGAMSTCLRTLGATHLRGPRRLRPPWLAPGDECRGDGVLQAASAGRRQSMSLRVHAH